MVPMSKSQSGGAKIPRRRPTLLYCFYYDYYYHDTTTIKSAKSYTVRFFGMGLQVL
jgi:hypothetical protein